MSKEKQIEEMAKAIKCTATTVKECPKTTCDVCKATALYNAGYRKQNELTPCDFCQFNPPSSGDGKPCSVCPAQAKMKGGE